MPLRGGGGRDGDRLAQRLTLVGALLGTLLATTGAMAGDPMPAPLSTAAPPLRPERDDPARPLPPVVTICRTSAPLRCWLRLGEDACLPGGEPYRVVITREDDVASALVACRTPPDETPGPP